MVKIEFIESYIKKDGTDYDWNDNHGELIRCRNCRYFIGEGHYCKTRGLGRPLKKDDFCSDGTKKMAEKEIMHEYDKTYNDKSAHWERHVGAQTGSYSYRWVCNWCHKTCNYIPIGPKKGRKPECKYPYCPWCGSRIEGEYK